MDALTEKQDFMQNNITFFLQLYEDRNILSRSLKLPTVWEWSVQFENSVQALFYNPLYIGKPKPGNVRRTQRVKVITLNLVWDHGII